jgi:NDP-sugar pyrophosphorylase family protein
MGAPAERHSRSPSQWRAGQLWAQAAACLKQPGWQRFTVLRSRCPCLGVYYVEPEVLRYIPSGVPFGFDDRMSCVLLRGMPASVFAHHGFWLDLGRVEDF